MKANEAPEKIYVHSTVHLGLLAASEINITGDDIEYTRTDAFIEKAWNWIEDILSSNQQDKSLLYFEQFKKYMEE